MIKWLKKIFIQNEVDSKLIELTRKTDEDVNIVYSKEIQKDFNDGYRVIMKDNPTVNTFKEKVSDLMLKSLRKTEYSDDSAFMSECSMFIHNLFAVVEDNFKYDYSSLKLNLASLDEYIYGNNKNREKLKVNIENLIKISKSGRFQKDPKENIVSYFVFFEENGISISIVIRDMFLIMEHQRN